MTSASRTLRRDVMYPLPCPGVSVPPSLPPPPAAASPPPPPGGAKIAERPLTAVGRQGGGGQLSESISPSHHHHHPEGTGTRVRSRCVGGETMSLHDLLRGFLGLRGYGGDGRRDSEGFEGIFFGGPSCDVEEDDDDFGRLADNGDHDDENDDSFMPGWGTAERGSGKHFSFGFNIGPDGQFRFHDNQSFGKIFHEMEQLFQNTVIMQPPHRFDLPLLPGPDDPVQPDDPLRPKKGQSLRDYMLKNPDEPCAGPRFPSRGGNSGGGGGHGWDSWPTEDSLQPGDRRSFHDLPAHPNRPFGLFDFFRRGFFQQPTYHPTVREDQDLDSRVKSEGLDSLLRELPPNSTPRPGSAPTPGRTPDVRCFSSVSVSTVAMPDGTVEERKTIISDGKKKTLYRRFDPRSERKTEQREEVVETGPL